MSPAVTPYRFLPTLVTKQEDSYKPRLAKERGDGRTGFHDAPFDLDNPRADPELPGPVQHIEGPL